ncbi:pirin family protein [Variovorax saccharolyticus]|uniref:pirin family protein n=1 Tax=Variovorax saccharolyticus TaxID=3053516 RepID=UPI002574C5A6|nr:MULTISPECIES: pirin family protein [unclassified Variovorax]MDM0016740.1 pirin family protein [Variovorax sp. J22R187]MDM0023290.1 pirin family protein [Variovorax sp. J31P216]
MTEPLLLQPHDKDLGGGFKVRRVLPAAKRRAVGPFVFFDHFGPATETAGSEHDVRPHPHIGLATVTYLFEGAMMHRDSLGSVQEIRPGAINWMTAGRGIVHSERKPEALLDATYVNHGLQLWAALPQAHEEAEPSFTHTAAADIPALEVQGVPVRVLIGEAFGARSPVATFSKTVYLDLALPAGARFELPALAAELAVYPVDGDITLDGEAVPQHTMAVLPEGRGGVLAAQGPVRLVVIGGEPLDGPRFITWNFVSSRRERILEAGADWAAQRMGQVPGETEFIPLPGHPFQVQQAADSGTTPA